MPVRRTALFIAAMGLMALVSGGAQEEKMEALTKEKILAAGPEWQSNYDQFQPAQDMLDALKSRLTEDVKIEVVLGLWCPDSRNNVPAFIKILDRTAAPVLYQGVPRKANRDIKYYAEDRKVERVPTFIVYRAGKEIGRIVENPKVGMLEDLMEIVFK